MIVRLRVSPDPGQMSDFGLPAGSFCAQTAKRRYVPPGRVLRESDRAWKYVAFSSSESTLCGASCREMEQEALSLLIASCFQSSVEGSLRSGCVTKGDQNLFE